MRTKTNSLGEVRFFVPVTPKKNYNLIAYCYPHSNTGEKFNLTSSKDGLVYEYMIEISCYYYNDTPESIAAFYEVNDTLNFSGFNAERLYDLMQEYPQMCLKAIPFYDISENENIINSRIHNFKVTLQQASIDLSRIDFITPRKIKNIFEDEEKQQPHIFFEVISIDGNCKD